MHKQTCVYIYIYTHINIYLINTNISTYIYRNTCTSSTWT